MSTFRNALVFFDELGVYDVVLPFLLIFTLVYAMLEKTKVFGVEEHNGHKVTRRNLNAMIAFCMSFLVVASSRLVAAINATIAKTMVILVCFILFMIVVGSFSKDEELYLKGAWQKVFMVIAFVGIVLILLYNLGWIQGAWSFAASNLSGPIVGSIGLLVIVLLFMYWITKSPGGGGSPSNGSNNSSSTGGGNH